MAINIGAVFRYAKPQIIKINEINIRGSNGKLKLHKSIIIFQDFQYFCTSIA